MAYVNKERKDKVAQQLELVLPKKDGWRWTLAGQGDSTMRLKISQGPYDLIENAILMASANGVGGPDPIERYCTPNTYHLETTFSGYGLITMQAVKEAMNIGNHDNSDAMTDYFDVGWYIDIKIGEYKDPFLHVVKPSKFDKYLAKQQAKYAFAEAIKVPQYKIKQYLPEGFNQLSPGKKAAATKKAKAWAAKELELS